MNEELPSNILVVGSGGREHALGWKLHNDLPEASLFFAPGNGGTQTIGENLDIGDSVDSLVGFAADHDIDLTVVGPEVPLADGVVDAFEEAGLSIFGPSQRAARLESSKAWASAFMNRHGIPGPESAIFTDTATAEAFVSSPPWKQIVIKADGLAAGKGVILPDTREEAIRTVRGMLAGELFGDAGRTIVIQERLSGPEVSVLAFSDGQTIVPLLPAQDHKRVFDNDRGPNTGGMGAFAPVASVNPELLEEIHATILKPTVDGMREEGMPYKGVLYAGLMLTNEGPKVLEYNVRFGDPETQPLMMLLQSNLAAVMNACIKGMLSKNQVVFKPGCAVCVVAAAPGYPGHYEKGMLIHVKGLQFWADGQDPFGPDVQVFQAGTIYKNGMLVTNGGRVFGVTSYGATMAEAVRKAYYHMGLSIYFNGMHYRKDIASGK